MQQTKMSFATKAKTEEKNDKAKREDDVEDVQPEEDAGGKCESSATRLSLLYN